MRCVPETHLRQLLISTERELNVSYYIVAVRHVHRLAHAFGRANLKLMSIRFLCLEKHNRQ